MMSSSEPSENAASQRARVSGRKPLRWQEQTGKHVRLVAGGALLFGLAAAAVVHSRDPRSLTHVLPHAGRTEYEINVFAQGRALTSNEVAGRYRLPFRGTTVLTRDGLREIIRHRERVASGPDETFVRMHLRPDGGEEEIWLWPES